MFLLLLTTPIRTNEDLYKDGQRAVEALTSQAFPKCWGVVRQFVVFHIIVLTSGVIMAD